MVQRQLGHMSRVAEDLLDTARIGRGEIRLSLDRIDLRTVIADTLEQLQPAVQAKHQQLALDVDGAACLVLGDHVRLVQVLGNVLGNAVRYTPERGAIALALGRAGDTVTVTVTDNGIGIPADRLATIFDMYSQVHQSTMRKSDGLGLGLSLVRALVELHGGSVAAASAGPGQGSTFTVRLPRSSAIVVGDAAPPPAPGSSAARRILVVEDNADACEVLRMLLELEGHQVAMACDGHAGLALALAGGFDAIVCDIGLPGIDGYELMTRLRATWDARPAQARPLTLALSGYGQPSDRERALAAGFDRYLVKPVAPGALIEALAAGVPVAGAAIH